MDKQSLAIRTRQWYEIVLEANSSSLSKKEWCRQNSISPKSFYYWLVIFVSLGQGSYNIRTTVSH